MSLPFSWIFWKRAVTAVNWYSYASSQRGVNFLWQGISWQTLFHLCDTFKFHYTELSVFSVILSVIRLWVECFTGKPKSCWRPSVKSFNQNVLSSVNSPAKLAGGWTRRNNCCGLVSQQNWKMPGNFSVPVWVVILSFLFCICQFPLCRGTTNVYLIGHRIYRQALSLARPIYFDFCSVAVCTPIAGKTLKFCCSNISLVNKLKRQCLSTCKIVYQLFTCKPLWTDSLFLTS